MLFFYFKKTKHTKTIFGSLQEKKKRLKQHRTNVEPILNFFLVKKNRSLRSFVCFFFKFWVNHSQLRVLFFVCALLWKIITEIIPNIYCWKDHKTNHQLETSHQVDSPFNTVNRSINHQLKKQRFFFTSHQGS